MIASIALKLLSGVLRALGAAVTEADLA